MSARYDDSEFKQLLTRFQRTFTQASRVDIMREVGERVGAAQLGALPGYPEPSGKPLPKIYQQTTAPRWKYKKVQGRYQKTGELQKGGAPRAYLSKWPSGRARRGFWYLLKAGKIKIPYIRSGTLGRSLTYAVADVTANGVAVDFGSNVEYVRRVIDENNQAEYHKGTWWTLQGEIRKAEPHIAAVAVNTFAKSVRRRLRA